MDEVKREAEEEKEINQWRREQEQALKEILSNPEKRDQLLKFVKDSIEFDDMLSDDFRE